MDYMSELVVLVCISVVESKMTKRKLTVGEQRCLLEVFYEDIYRDDKDFAGEATQFHGEGNNEVEDEVVHVADNIDFNNEPVCPDSVHTTSGDED